MTTIDSTASIAAGQARNGPGLRRVRDGYWRVTAASGAVLGYVEEISGESRARYRAKRLHSGLRILDIGEFGSRDDAAESLR